MTWGNIIDDINAIMVDNGSKFGSLNIEVKDVYQKPMMVTLTIQKEDDDEKETNTENN